VNDTTQTTNADLQNTVDVLTKPWTDVLSPKESGNGTYRAIDYPPMLDMLREAIGSSLGKTQSGKSPDAERSLLNLQAFQLWEHIDGTTRAWILDLSKERSPQELKPALNHLAGLIKALHASHQIDDNRQTHIIATVTRWRAQIWELFDPPVIKTLTGPCPNCTETHYIAIDGSKTTALIAYYWKGLTPEAKCQRCGEHWSGERELLELGYHIGAIADESTLREMGVM
jgi:hypothetical protein